MTFFNRLRDPGLIEVFQLGVSVKILLWFILDGFLQIVYLLRSDTAPANLEVETRIDVKSLPVFPLPGLIVLCTFQPVKSPIWSQNLHLDCDENSKSQFAFLDFDCSSFTLWGFTASSTRRGIF